MDLSDVAHQLVQSYSGGMIRRLEIAQSTLHRPKVLFLDEPTVGLDPLARHTVWEHVARLNTESGTTVVVTTHYMDEVEALCDRVAMLHQGALAAIDSPDGFKARIGPDATLDDAFAHFTGGSPEQETSYVEASRTRRAASRLG